MEFRLGSATNLGTGKMKFVLITIQKLLLLVLILYSSHYVNAQFKDTFYEELMLKTIGSGHVYAYFQFTTLYDVDKNDKNLRHTHLFPRGLGEIISRHHIEELHVSLTQGFWDYAKYGYPFQDAPPGAEVYAWFNANVSDVDKEWKGLTNALSGLLCASFNFVDQSNSLSPEFTFRPTGHTVPVPKSSHLRYASLPRETACTENLTPFKKLLPCDSKRGLATLLNAAYIHNTNYHSIGIHFRTFCANSDCSKHTLELKQTISLVYDTLTWDFQDWSLRKLFGTGLKNACPLASESHIYFDFNSNNTVHLYKLLPEPDSVILSRKGGQENKFGIYDVKKHTDTNGFNFQVVSSVPIRIPMVYPSILHANRYITGYGQERGSLVTKLYNNHHQPIDVILLENIPWYLPMYLHSIKILRDGQKVKPITLRYIPGRDRKQPYYLELVLRLPRHSMTKFSIDFEYMFLKWQEYPPDANHGFYMGPAIITAILPVARNYTAIPQDGSIISSSFNATRDGYLVQLRTEIILISLPTPDFSMPYNVICLACTAVALAFGPLHNISTKRLVLKSIEEQGLKGKLKSVISQVRKYFSKKEKAA